MRECLLGTCERTGLAGPWRRDYNAAVSFFLALAASVIALAIGYAIGRKWPAPLTPDVKCMSDLPAAPPLPPAAATASPPTGTASEREPTQPAAEAIDNERAQRVRSLEGELQSLRRMLAGRDALLAQLETFAVERRQLFDEVAAVRAETARFRQIVIDLETNAPPPLLGSPGTPDDLKLIVGIGPVLERMLFQLGITRYGQIACWSEREIDEIDSRLPEFPGRIRRDAWVTQARALHQSKYGTAAQPRIHG